jgi:hypothetical protein
MHGGVAYDADRLKEYRPHGPAALGSLAQGLHAMAWSTCSHSLTACGRPAPAGK